MRSSKVIDSPDSGGSGSDILEREIADVFSGFAGDISCLLEPLFNLPTRIPSGSSGEHIPFLFVLMKVLRPDLYVELGVNDGACLIAACTAAKTYDLKMSLYGIDSWQRQSHVNDGRESHAYNELKAYLESNFSNSKLIRSSILEALSHFGPESVDLLRIDGSGFSGSAKEDLEGWLDAMSPNGVIAVHGIVSEEAGEGARQFWHELRGQYTTLEFNHASGLGVALLDPDDGKVAPLKALANDEGAMQVYRSLVAMIEGVLPERMGYFRSAEMLAWNERLINALYQSASWKITAPLRTLKRIWSRKSRG